MLQAQQEQSRQQQMAMLQMANMMAQHGQLLQNLTASNADTPLRKFA